MATNVALERILRGILHKEKEERQAQYTVKKNKWPRGKSLINENQCLDISKAVNEQTSKLKNRYRREHIIYPSISQMAEIQRISYYKLSK